MAFIYKIINDVNNKIYIGQTSKSIEQRFERHCSESRWRNTKNMPIVLAIQKYGKQHFKSYLLEDLGNVEQSIINSRELYWVLKLNTFSPSGYNLKAGDGTGSLSEETKLKISKAHIGMKASDATRRRLSISHIGNTHTEETKRKLSEIFKGRPVHPNTRLGASLALQKTYHLINPNGKPETIINMKKYCNENGYSKSKMCELVRGKRKQYKGWTLPKGKNK